MSYSESQVPTATTAMEKYRGSAEGEFGAALVVVGLRRNVSPRRRGSETT